MTTLYLLYSIGCRPCSRAENCYIDKSCKFLLNNNSCRLKFGHVLQVNETRKGVKNVLKSFWRKPRDEAISPSSSPKSSQGLSIRYRYDRIETQILLLADISFIIKDYETALSMYKLVRDDYKADKSNFHLAHTYIMIALCYFLAEPHRVRDVQSQLEAIAQILPLTSEVSILINSVLLFFYPLL